MDIKTLLPKDKFDDSTMSELSQLTDEQIQPIILDLLEWLQDYNWPIAKKILPVLIEHQSVALPYISDILNGDDAMWKYWIMTLFLPELTEMNQSIFVSDVKKLAELKGVDEETKSIVEAAMDCLERLC